MLTDTQCRAARPHEKPCKLPDGSGLLLEVKPNGVKAWRYRFKLNVQGVTKESMFAIGDYAVAPRGETLEQAKARREGGRFTLAEARDERTRARDLVKQGINPAHERLLTRLRRDQDGATTFECVAREWLALKDWEAVTKARRLNMLQRVVFGKIGPLPIKQVTPMHVLDVLTTGSTRLNEMGYRPDWIERQLAHQEPNSVRRTYNHAEHLTDRVVMMQRWADLLDEWEKAASSGTAAVAAAR